MARQATGYSNRGNNNIDRASRKPFDSNGLYKETTGVSTTGLAVEAGKYYEQGYMVREELDHTGEIVEVPIVDRSLTTQQYLRVLPTKVEVEQRTTQQRYTNSLGIVSMVKTTDNKVVWRSSKTLLSKADPFKYPVDYVSGFKRVTSKSKRVDRPDLDFAHTDDVSRLPIDEIADLDLPTK